MKWKLYYGDGTTFSDEDGTWEEAPWRGLIALVVMEPDTGWFIEEGSDGRIQAYVNPSWTDNPIGVDYFGLVDYLLEMGYMTGDMVIKDIPPDELASYGVKIGRTIDTKEFYRLRHKASNDPDLPQKSARKWGERGE
jgi:hypothetical protein